MPAREGDPSATDQGDPYPTDRPTQIETEAELDDLITANEVVLVEFYTDGCGICASMEPVVGTVAKASDVRVGVVNPRDDPPLVDRFSVQSVPLFVLFQNGEPIARLADGFVGAEQLLSWIDSNASS